MIFVKKKKKRIGNDLAIKKPRNLFPQENGLKMILV